MRSFKRKFTKLAAVLMCALLLVPSFNFNTASAESKGTSVSFADSKGAAEAKVSKSLVEKYKKDEMVSFLVRFKEQVDTVSVAAKAEEKAAKQNLTPGKTSLAKRSTIVSELQATAKVTQADVLDFLSKQEASGKAKDVQSFYIVNGIAVTATKDVMEKIASFPEVEAITHNAEVQLYPNAEPTSSVEDAAPTSGNVEWNIEQVGAPATWDMGIDGSGVVVAVMDTGVQWDHPALIQQYNGYDFNNPNNPSHTYNWFDAVNGRAVPYDDHGHGTHVTGTVLGVEMDGTNAIGVAPGAKWIGVKILSGSGSGSTAGILAGAQYLLAPTDENGVPNPDMAPDVVNNSWGGGPGMDEWFRPMVQAWRSADIYPVFAAGNTTLTNPGGPGSVAVPANYPESYAVGATDINMNLGSFSLQGPSPYGEMKPEVSAPGVNIRSATPGSSYQGGWNGTSMAAPHVAGAVALLKQVNASLSIDDIAEILETTATPRTNSQYPEAPNNGFGHGIINVFDAVSSVISGLGTVKGNVTVDGDDDQAPVIGHDGHGETYAGLPVAIEASVEDNISVTSVVVEYSKGDSFETVSARRVSGDFKNGVYEATIPGEDVVEGELVYRIKATDFGGNETVSDDYSITVNPAPSVGYYQDFEESFAGWVTYGDNNTWEWGVPTSGPGSAYSGEKAVATNLAGQYVNNTYSILESPPIAVPESGEAFLQFKHWYNIENNWDFGDVWISADGGATWDNVATYTNVSNGWVDAQFDLSGYAGNTIIVSFDLDTDGSVVRDGWYIDDFRISDTALSSLETGKEVTPKKERGEVTKKGVRERSGERPDVSKFKDVSINVESNSIGPVALPLAAKVSILETGRSVNTNPANGSYSMTHATGDYTMVAEAYGHESQTQTVTIEDGVEANVNFNLEELAKGTVAGTVTNEATGLPVEGATIYLMEDAAVAPATTDANGAYSLTGYEGEYTLKVVAPSYYSQEFTVTLEGNVELNVELKPFIGFPGEIGYDDGTAENARAFYDAGNGWAVKMSLEEGHNKALVTGGIFRFWDTEWPVPGGTAFQVAIHDANGADGAPGTRLAGPIDATALRDGTWTHVDLSEEGIVVEGDFYMVYIQSHPNPNTPGLATDEDGPNAGRSWQMVGGAWSPAPTAEGNYMIRAAVNYEVTAPTISSPVDGTFTNESSVTVEGTSAPSTTVHVYNNGEEVGTASTSSQGTYSVEVSLSEGENSLTAKASTENGMTDASEAVVVVLDQVAPEVEITSPVDGLKTNRETVTVEGTVEDENIDSVTVNGQSATVSNGTFSKRILLDEGANEIEVVATDKAGNTSSDSMTVYAKFSDITISNVEPSEDVTLRAGESVTISFSSEEDLDASFVLRMPLTNLSGLNNATELPLTEVAPGQYEVTWTAPSTIMAEGVEIEVIARDDYGNESREIAAGKLHINGWQPGDKDRPVRPLPGRPDLPDLPVRGDIAPTK
ncbi:S8 family serine peptidase [Sutcliffiella cohnii]|nr:S8 family serine peptidase [Sutcliffiella cohnii]MED4017411.1 S8 family serine peptidase [Sutcliffiella cohnii]